MPKTTTIIIDNPTISKWLNNKAKEENLTPEIVATTILTVWLNGENNKGILAGVADPNLPISSFIESPSLIDALNAITQILNAMMGKIGKLELGPPPNPNSTPINPITPPTEPSQEDIQFAEEIKEACIAKAKELNIPTPTLHQLYSSNFNLDFNTSIDVPSLDKLNLTLANMLNQKKGKIPLS